MGLLHVVGSVLLSVLSLSVGRGGLLAGNQVLAVFVHLQLGDDDVGRVDADVGGGTCEQRKKEQQCANVSW